MREKKRGEGCNAAVFACFHTIERRYTDGVIECCQVRNKDRGACKVVKGEEMRGGCA